jgi:phage antirepressor YoqD-like protein
MSELIIFNNPEFGQIRTIEEDGKVLFCGSDVAKALGYKRPKDAVSAHCKGAVKRRTLTNGGEQEMNFIPEGDIYRLAARSELPGADQFERWIFDEVLPSIRKNGGYINGQENMTPEELMAAALIMANKTIENQKVRLSALTVENQIMQPKADYFDDLVDRNLLTGLRETAKELGVKPKEFISFLLSRKYLYRDKKGKLMPYQVHVNNGLFELKECFNEKTQWTGTQTLVTPKGRETFRLLFLKAG